MTYRIIAEGIVGYGEYVLVIQFAIPKRKKKKEVIQYDDSSNDSER